jgi:hypothetical protein
MTCRASRDRRLRQRDAVLEISARKSGAIKLNRERRAARAAQAETRVRRAVAHRPADRDDHEAALRSGALCALTGVGAPGSLTEDVLTSGCYCVLRANGRAKFAVAR